MGLISRVSSRTYRNLEKKIETQTQTNKKMPTTGLACILSFTFLLYSAYSASQIPNDKPLPFDIVLQAFIGFIASSISVVWYYGNFKSIVSSNDQETATSDYLQKYKASMGFMTFNHRGRYRTVY